MISIGRIGKLGLGVALLTLPAALHADPAPPPESIAPIALMLDLSSGQVLHSREIDRRFLPASVTKVMTTYLAFEMLADGRLKPEQAYVVPQKLAEQWSGKGSSLFLKAGDRVTVDTLMHGITTVSANDGAMMLAQGAAGSVEQWVAQMNRAAAGLGMNDSHFGTPNGWPDEGATFTTAHDLALLGGALTTRYPDLYARYFGHRSYGYNGVAQANHDPITGVVPGADGIKTGYTREAGYNFLGSGKRGERRLVMVIAGTDSEEARTQIARDYLEWGFSAFEQRSIFPTERKLGTARVQDGAVDEVSLKTTRTLVASVPRGARPKVTLALRYRGPIKAPIAKGQQIAELEVRIEGFAPYRVHLEAMESVPKANQFRRLVNGVVGWFA